MTATAAPVAGPNIGSTHTTSSPGRTRPSSSSRSRTAAQSASRVTTRSSLDGYDVVDELAHRHSCPSDCQACAAAQRELEAAVDADTVDGWQAFVLTDSARRLVEHARRAGSSELPPLSTNKTIQWLLEEALFCRAELEEAFARLRAEEEAERKAAVDGSKERLQHVLKKAAG